MNSLNCDVQNQISANPDFKCFPDLIDNKAEPSTVCILKCKSNPIKYIHRCNQNGHWDIEPGSKSCNDMKMCMDPKITWTHWTWTCSLGFQQGSRCVGTCNTNLMTQTEIQCEPNGTWKSSINLDDTEICSQKCT